MAAVVESTSTIAFGTGSSLSSSITVDADADAVFVFFGYWASNGAQPLSAITLGGNAPDEQQVHAKAGDANTNNLFVAAWYAGGNLPASGSRTLAITLNFGAADGPVCHVVQVSGVVTTGWRSVGTDSYTYLESVGANQSVSLTTVSGDYVLKFDYKYDTPLPALTSGWTAVNTQANNGSNSRSSSIVATGTTTVANTENENYSGIVALAIEPASAGGPTAYEQAVAGGFTPAGARVLSTQKAPSGGVTPSGVRTLSIQKSQAGTLTPTSVLATVVSISRTVTGSLTPTGGVTKSVAKALAGVVVPLGSVVRNTGKTVVGSLSFTGTSRLLSTKTLVGSITPSSTLDSILSFIRSVEGSLTPSSNISKFNSKVFAGSVVPTSSVNRGIFRTLIGSLTPNSALNKVTFKAYAGTLTPASTLSNQVLFTQIAGGILVPVGTLGNIFTPGGGGGGPTFANPVTPLYALPWDSKIFHDFINDAGGTITGDLARDYREALATMAGLTAEEALKMSMNDIWKKYLESL